MGSGTSQAPRRGTAFGLAPRIVTLAVSGILLLGVCVTAIAWYLLESAATKAATERVETNSRVAWEIVRAHGKSFRIADGKLLIDDHVLNGDAATVARIKSLVGGTSTVFMNDLRITTNVMKPDGTPAVGTRLAPGNAYDAIFNRKVPFRGEVEILGEPYMTAYDPILDSTGQVLGILYVGIKKAEFLEAARSTIWTIIYSTLAIASLAMLVNYLVTRSGIVRPLKASITTMNRLAQGDLSVETPEPSRRDEIGEIMMALVAFKATGLEVERMRADRLATDQHAAEQRKADMIRLADEFENTVGEIVETVSSASGELENFAGTLTTTAERAQGVTTMVAAASEKASTNVQSVASATEQMASSVNEISRQVQESARMAGEAVDQARTTNDRVGELSKAAARIGDVVELINTIAGQTNLLALNATIEAARAGEAGRGFAVVASEVKALAEQTAKATGEIGHQIAGIQAATQELGEFDQGDQRHHRKAVGDLIDHRGGGGRAGRGDAGNFPQRAAGGARHPAGLLQHHRRPARCDRNRLGLLAGSHRGEVAVRRQQSSEGGGRQVPQFGESGITMRCRNSP